VFRVKKVDGWNKFKIQERWMFIFWKDYGGVIFTSKAQADAVILTMIMQQTKPLD
jgi:hypothetical protein